MSRPPHPPRGDDGAGVEGSGSSRWRPPPDEPTERLGPPGQRDPTRRLPPPGQFGAPWGPPGAPAGGPPRGNRTTAIALVVVGVVVLAAVGVALFLLLDRGDVHPAGVSPDPTTASRTASDAGALPDPTGTPEGLGNDPLLDDLATACYVGDMRACDDLFDESDAGSDYETYGDSCAGRQPPGTLAYCTETFPEN